MAPTSTTTNGSSWPDLPRPVPQKPAKKNGNLPVAGRKFCTMCGRWRLLVEFQVARRSKRGVALNWQSRCKTCYRVRKRELGGHTPRRIGRLSPEERRARDRVNQARRLSDPTKRERRREYDRMYKAAQRRAAGIAPRPFSKPRPYETTHVDNAPVREAFLASGLTPSEVCHAVGWLKAGTKSADTSMLMRRLGLKDQDGRVRSEIRVEDAAAILRALDVDPVDVGL